MRIAFEVSAVLGTPAGIGYYTASLLEALVEIRPGLDIRPFAVTTKKNSSLLPEGLRSRVKRLPLPGRVGVTAWTAAAHPRVFSDVDVVHGTNFWLPPLKRRNGVVTIHDLTFLLYPQMCTPQIRRYRWIVPKVLEGAEMVITPSQTVADQVAEHLSFPSERIAVTFEGIRRRLQASGRNDELLSRLGVNGNYVLFVGTMEPRKNLARLVRALLNVDSDVSLVVAGPRGWGGVDVVELADELKLGGRVVVTGYLSDGDLASVFAGAAAFVFPSIYEGFGLPPLEAMGAGVPVVAAEAGSLPEVLGDAPFWCDPLSEESIAAAITAAITPGTLRESAIEQGRVQAAKYTWERTARLTLEAYEKVAGRT